MRLHPLQLPDQPEDLRTLVVRGEALALARRIPAPRTVDEILREASHRMDLEDAFEAYCRGESVAHLVRHPRKTFRQYLRLAGR